MAFGTGGNARLVSLVALQAFVGVEMTGVHIGNFMAVHGDGLAFGSFGVAVDAGLFGDVCCRRLAFNMAGCAGNAAFGVTVRNGCADRSREHQQRGTNHRNQDD